MKVIEILNLPAIRIPNEPDVALTLQDDTLVFILPFAGVDTPETCCVVRDLGVWKKSNAPELECEVVSVDVSPDGLLTLLI